MSVPINSKGMSGYSFPLSPNGDLHHNSVGNDHWTVRFRHGVETHLDTKDVDQMIESWRTNRLGNIDFKAFK